MDQEKHFLQILVEMANENMALMDGTTRPVKGLIEGGDLVIGVWQDSHAQHGVGFLVLKGARLLAEVIASRENIRTRTTAIPCECYEQALAAKQAFGERDHDA